MTKLVHVAVGVVLNPQDKILIARRPDHLHMGGYWEFPGGKVEAQETVQQALARELREEVAIEVKALKPLIEIHHDYGEKIVLLDTWWVTEFAGVAAGREGQEIAWVTAEELNNYQFPDANQAIIEVIVGAGPRACPVPRAATGGRPYTVGGRGDPTEI